MMTAVTMLVPWGCWLPFALWGGAGTAPGQGAVLGARHLDPAAPVKIFAPAGSVRLIGWDRDSIVVRGTVGADDRFFFAGTDHGVKLGIQDRADGEQPAPSKLEIFLPRGSRASVKAVSAAIDGADVSGWFYSISGRIHLTGKVQDVQAESMEGTVDVSVDASWVRLRSGSGTLVAGGRVKDLGVATVQGPIAVTAGGIMRGRFQSTTGEILFSGTFSPGGILEFDDHSGRVALIVSPTVGADFDLATVDGPIVNALTAAKTPTADRGRALSFTTGHGGAQVVVRNFSGAIEIGKP